MKLEYKTKKLPKALKSGGSKHTDSDRDEELDPNDPNNPNNRNSNGSGNGLNRMNQQQF